MNRLRPFLIIVFLLATAASCKSTPEQNDFMIRIPRLANFVADGSDSEWGSMPPARLYANHLVKYPHPDDLTAYMKAAWNDDHLLLLFEIYDNEVKNDTVHPWNADAIEIFLAPSRGSGDILQLEVVPGVPVKENVFTSVYDHRKSPGLRSISPRFTAVSKRKDNKTLVEVAIDPASVGMETAPNTTLALQIYVDDSDGGEKNQVQWFSVGHSYTSSFAMFPVMLTENEYFIPSGSSRMLITDDQEAMLYVFGAGKGDRIEVYNEDVKILDAKAVTTDDWTPDSFDLSKKGLDYENDVLSVKINGQSTGFHELYFAPRRYIHTKKRPFDREIRNFGMLDRKQMPPEDAVLFIGSSSIRKWNSLQEDFPELDIIHRGFGGSTTEEVLMYMDEIVLPYKPSKILIYEGDNDVPRGYSAKRIQANIRTFIEKVHQVNPGTDIYIISPKPSIGRMYYWPKYQEAHKALRELAQEYPDVEYIDVAEAMFDSRGNIREEVFLEDGVHMNEKGYAIWTEVIREHLGL